MTQHDKDVLKRLGVVIGILTVIGCLFGLLFFPPLALFILIGGILVWGVIALIAVVFGYIFNGQ